MLAKLLFTIYTISIIGMTSDNEKYMQSRRLRTSNLSTRYYFEAGYNF